MDQQLSTTAAVMVFFMGTFATVAFTLTWALSNRRPVRPHPHLTGRAADPYWYTPTGRQDERGIRSADRP